MNMLIKKIERNCSSAPSWMRSRLKNGHCHKDDSFGDPLSSTFHGVEGPKVLGGFPEFFQILYT